MSEPQAQALTACGILRFAQDDKSGAPGRFAPQVTKTFQRGMESIGLSEDNESAWYPGAVMRLRQICIVTITALFVMGCASSSLRIVDSGFSAVETSPSQFAVKLESDQIRTEEEAEANLLVHSARWTIDHSGFFFTISDRIHGRESKIDLEQEAREDGGAGVPTVTQAGTGGYASSTTGSRRTTWSVRATLRIYRDKPDDVAGTIYEATRVLDQYRAAQTGSSSRVGAGVGSRP